MSEENIKSAARTFVELYDRDAKNEKIQELIEFLRPELKRAKDFSDLHYGLTWAIQYLYAYQFEMQEHEWSNDE